MTPEARRCLDLYFHRILTGEWERFDAATAYVCTQRGVRYSERRMEEARDRWERVRCQWQREIETVEILA